VGGEIAATNAALTEQAQNSNGDQRDHLFVIYPISAGCLTGTNLRQFGPCFQFSAFPHFSPRFDPKVKVGICEPLHVGESLPGSQPALGHLEPLTRITETTGIYPNCLDLVTLNERGSWHDGFGGALRRVAFLAKSMVTPTPLYAVHGGLGGLGGGISPFGAVDLEVFHATFTADTVGKAPGNPEAGSWSQQFKAPGSILVRHGLGDDTTNLAVLDQGGGNCGKCFGLLLQGNLATEGAAASAGIYDTQWTSLQDNANMKEAVFALRDSLGNDIARVTYAVRNNQNVILYNDVKGTPGTFIKSWVQHQKDSFRIVVDIDNQKTTLYVNGSSVAKVENAPFVGTQATKSFSSVSADFRGIDSGVMGWDNIRVIRLADTGF
jgi:hypothetical protein